MNRTLRGQAASQRQRGRGFTLVEMLVVVVIIGILAVSMVLSLGDTGRDRAMEQERDRLTALISYVREQGALQTLEYGLHLTPSGYRFTVYDNRNNAWVQEDLDDILRPRTLPDGLSFTLVLEGRPVVLDPPDTRQLGATTPDVSPQIMLFSNGDLNSFELTIRRATANRTVTLRSTETGKIEVGDIVESTS
ncbi:MAG: type II secretion system minor pseudopilin GspH [Steroidobacteraceae bacterium]